MCGSRKYPYSPHRRDWNFLGGGGLYETKNLKKCLKLNWNFQRGGEVLENPLHGGCMDIFWNYTMSHLVNLGAVGTQCSLLNCSNKDNI